MATSKYFNVEFYPTLTGAQIHAGNIVDGELLLDWQKVAMPKGSARLLGVTAFIKGNAGTLVRGAFELLFADNNTNSIDDVNDASSVASSVRYFRDTKGYVNMDIDENSSKVPGFAIAHAGSADEGFAPFVITPTTNSPFDGEDHFYVGAIKGATNFNFATGITLDGELTAGATTVTVNGNADTRLTVGDDLITQNEAVIGKIKSITNATTIVLESAVPVTIATGKKVLSTTPMKFIFHFER